MSSIIIQGPSLGLNALVQENLLGLQEASKYSQNMLYERGLAKTAYGFAKLNLTTTGVDSGNPVIGLFQWNEIDGYSHLHAISTTKILEHDRPNSTWADRTQSGKTMDSDLYHPISYMPFGHDDTAIFMNDDSNQSNAYHHLIVCDGGQSDIQRWAGRYETDFADLVGAGGYHDGTTHRALKVDSFRGRVLLLSPKNYNSSSKLWIPSDNRIQYSALAKMQTWTGTGSGFIDLLETGGRNVWGEQLSNQYIIYQDKSIWGLNYVGGTTVYDPVVLIRDLGLLAPHLMVSKNNIHYFVGNDYNVYAYYGGSMYRAIGDKIHSILIDELAYTEVNKCWMMVETYEPRLWVFIVTGDNEYITRAYGMDLRTENWTVRTFDDIWSDSGITAVGLAGATSYQIGDTYQAVLNQVSTHISADTTQTSGDPTVKYSDWSKPSVSCGDMLLTDTSHKDITPSNFFSAESDWSHPSWCNGGLEFVSACANNSYLYDMTVNDMLMIVDGSKFNAAAFDCRYGTHYYTIKGLQASSVCLWPRDSSSAVCVSANQRPAVASICWYVFSPTGKSYRQTVTDVQTEDMILFGDATGFVYMAEPTQYLQDEDIITSYHVTPIFDLGDADIKKRWPGIFFTASGETLTVEYRISNFDTSETGWEACG